MFYWQLLMPAEYQKTGQEEWLLGRNGGPSFWRLKSKLEENNKLTIASGVDVQSILPIIRITTVSRESQNSTCT